MSLLQDLNGAGLWWIVSDGNALIAQLEMTLMNSPKSHFACAFVGAVLGFVGPARAQLVTEDLTAALSATDLVNTLVGPGVTVTNIQFFGANSAAGTFSGGTGIVGFANGIILSSGCVSNVIAVNGLNNSSGTTCDNQEPGDPELDLLIPGYTTFDRCVLEFDFECENIQVISFEYVFSSEEYNEYANTSFNDVFGFFVNGVNVALLPDNVTPVSINNVNCGNPVDDPTPHNCGYFINNSCQGPPGFPDEPFPCAMPRLTEMDGMTVVLNVFVSVNPGVNHIKLAIADAGDTVLDSNVFIRTQSFTCTPPGTTGACCLPNGTCDDETAADCAEDGGVFHPDTDCKTFSCSTSSCPADVTDDGLVNVSDLLAVITHWGPCPVPCPSDINGSGDVNVSDLLTVINSWGKCP